MHGVPNKDVQAVIGQMGFKKPREERPAKVDPRVARLLAEELGVKYNKEDIQEANGGPAMGAGSAPMADPGTAAAPAPVPMPEATPGKTPGTPGEAEPQPGPQAKVELKSDVNRITTLQDLKGKMDEIATKINLIDTLSQALMGDQTSDNSIEKHRKTLVSAVEGLGDSVDDLRSALGATAKKGR